MDEVEQQVTWRNSGRCDTGMCVEVAMTDEYVLVRDSKDPNGPRLVFSHEEWAAFRGGILDGEFVAG